MCVITEKSATKHCWAMLSKLFIIGGILIGGARAPWAPLATPMVLGRGQYPHAPLNNFSDFLGKK